MKNKTKQCVEWSITRLCNNSCSYCVTLNERKKMCEDPQPKDLLKPFLKLEGRWSFVITGLGEPFLAPDFLHVVESLVNRGHRISVVSNFSVSQEHVERFLDIVGDKLDRFNISLHLESVDWREFFKKALWLKEKIDFRLGVQSVAVKDRISELKEIGKIFVAHGIDFQLQPQKNYKTSKYIDYSSKEREVINFFKKRATQNKNINFKGKKCWAGSKYFIVDELGDAWRCWPGKKRRKYDNSVYLGNLLDNNFKLNNDAQECTCDLCYCVLPQRLGMIVDD